VELGSDYVGSGDLLDYRRRGRSGSSLWKNVLCGVEPTGEGADSCVAGAYLVVNLWGLAFVTFDIGYEMLRGIIFALGAGLAFFGLILISDSLWKMKR
jgi:hypothetical protein